MNNPLPIPGAMLAPLYGDSATAPVSSAPDIPSHATSDYQDPVDDVNKSYQQLQNSITEDDEPVIGKVQNIDFAPSEIEPPHYCDACDWPTPNGRYPGRIGSDGRPTIDLEALEAQGIELSQRQWEQFEYGGDEYRLSVLDPIPGYTPQETPDLADSTHLLLGLLGLVPVAGEWADGLNRGWYAAEEDVENAALSCAAVVPFIGVGATAAKAARGGKVAGKSANMPSRKTIGTDIGHIVDNHTAGGKGYKQSGIKDKFPDYMSGRSIESTVRQAYRNAQKVGPSQGDRYLMRGYANGMTIEMWVNVATKEIETAYPVGR
jgi:hypothetical protein